MTKKFVNKNNDNHIQNHYERSKRLQLDKKKAVNIPKNKNIKKLH